MTGLPARPGQAVAVRDDPETPGEAVLELGAPVWGVLAEVLVPLLRIAMGVPVRTRRQLTARWPT